MTTIVHVHQQVIRQNLKYGRNEPPLTVKSFRGSIRGRPVKSCRAHQVSISGPARIVHDSIRPLPCGARVWIETESEVTCDDSSSVAGGAAPEIRTDSGLCEA